MPRKPNYKFERMERDRAKAAKKEARRQARSDRKAPGTDDPAAATGETAGETPAPVEDSGTGNAG